MYEKSTATHFVAQSRVIPRRIAADLRSLTLPTRIHHHGFLEFELVIDGTGEQLLNGRTMKLKKGSAALLRFTDYHRIVPDERIEFVNVSFDEELLSEELRERINSSPTELCRELNGDTLAAVEAIGRLLANEKGLDVTEPDAIHVRYAANLIECLLIKLLDFDFIEASGKSSVTALVIKRIRENFHENPKLSEIARELHYNPRHLGTCFKREIGVSFSDFLKKSKLDHAKRMLLMTELNIDYVGMECGFNTPSNFRRLFKESFGMTPGEFRRMSRG